MFTSFYLSICKHKELFLFVCSSFLCGLNSNLSAARPSASQDRASNPALYQMQNQIRNHETEISIFQNKFQNQEAIIDGLRRQVDEKLQRMQECVDGQQSLLQGKSEKLENINKEIALELKSYATDNNALLRDYQKRIGELEKIIDKQNQNIENLKMTLKNLIDAQMREGQNAILGAVVIYVVKPGDSLEKIAKMHKTTIKKLKEINQLSGDQIIIGQKLNVPE